MTPVALHSFFAASASVAGALIGLLFVVISVAQERLTAPDAAQSHRVRASAALSAFINALTVSLFALLPGDDLGGSALAVSVVGLLFVTASLLSLLRVNRSQPGEARDALFLVGLVVALIVQLCFAVALLRNPADAGAANALAILVIVCFLIGIARSWELIGGPSIGLRGEIASLVRARSRDGGEEN